MPAMTSVLAAVGLVGAGVSAYGQYQAGQEAKSQENYNAQVLQQQAAAQRASAAREAEIIRQNATLNEYRQRKQMAINVGSQVGAYAKSGVAVGTGSPLDVIADDIANQELEIQLGQWNAKNDAATTIYNAEIGAKKSESEAEMRRRYGRAAATNATYQSVGTLLSSGTQYGSYLSKEKTKIGQ